MNNLHCLFPHHSYRPTRALWNLLLLECCPNKTQQKGGCRLYYHAHHLWLNIEQVLGDVSLLLFPVSLQESCFDMQGHLFHKATFPWTCDKWGNSIRFFNIPILLQVCYITEQLMRPCVLPTSFQHLRQEWLFLFLLLFSSTFCLQKKKKTL